MSHAVATPLQRPSLALGATAAGGLFVYLLSQGDRHGWLLLIGLGLGITLYHAAFGFSGAYRRLVRDGDMSGVTAQLIMIALAVLMFTPILMQGSVFGRFIGPALAPAGTSVAVGAFVFGVGMQLAGGCASGTLFTAGGGNPRMMIVLVAFCGGAFWGSLDLGFWSSLPEIGTISLSDRLGMGVALPLQLGLLAGIYGLLRLSGARNRQSLWWQDGFSPRLLLTGPWPLLLSAALLALLNWATLLVAGHPWSITWAFSLWAAKTAVAVGWDPATSAFWSGGFQQAALGRSILADNTSVMNIGLIIGAFLAASAQGRLKPRLAATPGPLIAAVVGGVAMGYGARLAYGCNIGAFFSGIASFSLHGWLWILCAIPGNLIGIVLRPRFGLDR